ncbi:MAG: chemotaxis protein CheW [Opitutaceae bacterium]|nr:chemotaxis protein CheW [Opitutaceae bacterium]
MNPSSSLGLVRIGDMTVAIPAELIEGVVCGPLELTPFPRAPAHVLGAFVRRGSAIPVIDLAAVIKPAAHEASKPTAYAVVLHHAAGRFAVLADATLGVVRAEPGQLSELAPPAAATDSPILFTRLYTPPDGGRAAVLLDFDAVLEIDGLRLAVTRPDSGGAAAQSIEHDERGDAAEAHVLFKAGGVCLALLAKHVRSVERRTEPLASDLEHPVLRGFYRSRGADLPVVDLPALLGLSARVGETSTPLFLIATHENLVVALIVDDIVGIEVFSPSKVRDLPEGGFARPEFYSGTCATSSGEAALVLHAETLLHAAHVVDMAELFAVDETSVAADGSRASTAPYLVYRAGGGALATRLSELDAVMALPANFTDLRGGGDAVVGMTSRFETSFQVLDLGALLGQPTAQAGPGSPILVARTEGGLVGYLVERIEFIQLAAARPLHHARGRAHGRLTAFREQIRARAEGRDVAACVLDLAALDVASAVS